MSVHCAMLLPLIFHFRSGEIQHDHYTAPAANMELGLLHLDLGNFDEAEKILESAK